MPSVDLHTIKHKDAESLVENFIIKCSLVNDYPIEIITGNSDSMKKIVIDILDLHKFKYNIGNFTGNNQGVIIVTG